MRSISDVHGRAAIFVHAGLKFIHLRLLRYDVISGSYTALSLTAVYPVLSGDPALSGVDAFFLALGLLYDEPNSVDQAEKNLLALCQGQDDIEIGRRLRERKSVHHLAVLSEIKPEPMQCDRTMTRVERQEHRRLNGLCFYCGDSTHAISDCPKRTKRFDRSAVIGTVQSKFLLSITLICSLSSYSVMAFVDSGAALNLMDLDYAKRCGFFLEPLRCPIPLRGIDATPLAKNKPQYWAQLTMCMAPAHQEVIRFLVLHNLHDVVVLGLPWLQTHNPVLDWNSMSVSSWGCQGVHGDVPFLSISSSTPSEVPEFLSDYQNVFEEPKSDALPPHRDCDCAINLIPGSKFPKGRLFNLSVPEHTAMRSYVKESLEKGHIRPSSSPLGAGFFFVAKKDGSLRPCIDYRLLNKITVKFQYPLPLLSDLFARIKGASWFTKKDLRGAYNLVRIRQGDEWKTAFNTPEGHFEYLVMPFGLANAPSVFQSFMHDIFREYLDKFLIVYLDDILIFSDDWESHVKQVRMVFQVLRANSLFVKGSKCLFGVQKVSFLGFIFSPSSIEMDPVKVQAIQDWTQPTSLKSLQKFLGFANFYRRFICNFSGIARPLTDLTKKGADLVNWSSAAVEAFQELKRRFCSAPVLCQPDVSLPFQVEVDASEIGAAGAVLSQRGSGCSVLKPCAFFSRKFSAAERNYDVGNRELLAMKWAFEEWRHWLEGAKHRVVVLTDHKNITYLESAKRLNPRQARWSLFFARFDFVISYLPGSKNVKADALSRSFVPDSPGLSEPASILKEGVIVSAISPDLRRVLQKFQANKPDRCPAEKLFVPDRWTSKVISELHCSVLAGHPGIFGTRDVNVKKTNTTYLHSGVCRVPRRSASLHCERRLAVKHSSDVTALLYGWRLHSAGKQNAGDATDTGISLQPEFQSIFRWSNETNQERKTDKKAALTILKSNIKPQTDRACPTSLRYRVQNDSYFKNLFNFDIPVLMWDSHFTEGAKENMSMRPPPYGWKNLPTEDAMMTLLIHRQSSFLQTSIFSCLLQHIPTQHP
ncbi:unnamed protein product [Ranitomeya imitator]|uniref:Reverse transcriptase n=1 Tax=Ranitomeya imitator TaxID=111125 RepID=A0ABN9KN51_9NEOB|nr:unnamed protein product [Ranitomeya imitator]